MLFFYALYSMWLILLWHQHAAAQRQDHFAMLIARPRFDIDHAAIRFVLRLALLEHFSLSIDRIAVKSRRMVLDALVFEISDAAPAHIRHRHADRQAEDESPVDQPLAMLRAL